MKLIAQKPLRYAGVSLNVGDEFEASDKDAKLLKVIGKASDVSVTYVPVDPVRDTVEDTYKPKRGRPKKVEASDDDEEAPEENPAKD